MESSEQTGAYIYLPICTNRLIFGKGLFHLFLSEYTNQSQNFTNLNFCDISLLYFQDFYTSASITLCLSYVEVSLYTWGRVSLEKRFFN